MPRLKQKRSEVDRWTGDAITNVGKNTPTQQRAIDEANAALRKKQSAKKKTGKK